MVVVRPKVTTVGRLRLDAELAARLGRRVAREVDRRGLRGHLAAFLVAEAVAALTRISAALTRISAALTRTSGIAAIQALAEIRAIPCLGISFPQPILV